jgi:hypothetical protein
MHQHPHLGGGPLQVDTSPLAEKIANRIQAFGWMPVVSVVIAERTTREMRALGLAIAFVLGMTAVASAASVKIENDTPWQIDHVYISAASVEDWGYDRLSENQVIAPGETWSFRFTGGDVCLWDFRVTFHDGTHRTLRDQDLCRFSDPIWKIHSS